MQGVARPLTPAEIQAVLEGIKADAIALQSVAPLKSTTYILHVEDTSTLYTCMTEALDTVTVTVIDCDTLGNVVWLPNIFSPNGDGSNDVLFVRGNKIDDITFTIYNRWGERVFESQTLYDGWDGRYFNEPLNDGVFVYKVTGTYTDGTPFDIKGNVTLVR